MTTQVPSESGMRAAAWAQWLVATGPVVPWVIWMRLRGRDQWSAAQAARAVNMGVLVAVLIVSATLVRLFVPLLGFLGTLAQLTVIVVAVALSWQAGQTVRRGRPATYPYEIRLVKNHD